MRLAVTCTLVALVAFGIGFWLSSRFRGRNETIVRLTEPLVISSSDPDQSGILPTGTTLHFDHDAGAESYSVYRIYVNVHGSPLPHRDSPKPWFIDPLTAYRD